MTDGTAPPPSAHEIHELGQLVARLDDDTGHDLVVQGLDLTDHDHLVLATTWTGSVLLGCRLGESARDHVVATGGLVFPPITGVPYRPYRSRLYDRDELLAGYERGRPESIEDTLDHRIYRHQGRYRGPHSPEIPILEALAQRLHDHAIDNALANLLARHPRVVAVMGGHALRRDEPAYRRVARLGRRLTEAGYFVATGGGPGAMEAANLGAWMGGRHPTDLDDAVSALARVGDDRASGYLDAGFEVLDRWPDGTQSLAIPTWFYGHEPTNQFATHIAKYFSNSLREDGLLAIATHGVVYTPGMAGTVQEIFMDATQNHYGTFHVVSPMVFLGRDYWTTTLPAVPLVRRLADGRAYASYLAVTDDPDEAVAFILDHPPTPA